MVQCFCPLKIETTQFPDGFRLNNIKWQCFRIIFYRKISICFLTSYTPTNDGANCQRSASSSALVLNNSYKGFGAIVNTENLMVTPCIIR